MENHKEIEKDLIDSLDKRVERAEKLIASTVVNLGAFFDGVCGTSNIPPEVLAKIIKRDVAIAQEILNDYKPEAQK